MNIFIRPHFFIHQVQRICVTTGRLWDMKERNPVPLSIVTYEYNMRTYKYFSRDGIWPPRIETGFVIPYIELRIGGTDVLKWSGPKRSEIPGIVVYRKPVIDFVNLGIRIHWAEFIRLKYTATLESKDIFLNTIGSEIEFDFPEIRNTVLKHNKPGPGIL